MGFNEPLMLRMVVMKATAILTIIPQRHLVKTLHLMHQVKPTVPTLLI